MGDRFLDRVINQEERDTLNLNRVQSLQGYWASKERYQRLWVGIGRDLSFLDITISKDRRGKPHFKLSVEAGERFNIRASSLSIAHDGGFQLQ